MDSPAQREAASDDSHGVERPVTGAAAVVAAVGIMLVAANASVTSWPQRDRLRSAPCTT